MTDWFKPRRYRHFDRTVGESFASKVSEPSFVAAHSFSPLIHFSKFTKRYKKPDKKLSGKIETKERPIMYASHRDACILSYYAYQLNERLNQFYERNGLATSVVAYRKLGKGNYDHSAAAYNFAISNSPCTILAFDVSGFFDSLDHKQLKNRLKRILGVNALPEDWYRVFRFVTDYHYVDTKDMRANPMLRARLDDRAARSMIATISEVKAQGIPIRKNSNISKGIPQGTPISASLSNLFMMDFDVAARAFCQGINALYVRYSDDILVICPQGVASEAEAEVLRLIDSNLLSINTKKTERTQFISAGEVSSTGRAAQYLGFAYYPGGPGLRPSSLSRQWRKLRKNVRRVRRVASASIANGKTTKVFTKKLRARFSSLPLKNFSSYARRSAKAFGGKQKILSQVKRIEREFETLIIDLKKLEP